MKIIDVIVLTWICLSSCKKVPAPRQCIHKIDGTDGVVEFPGMMFNDKARKLFTEGRKMGRICIIHGKIPEHKDLILKIDSSVSYQNWISFGGRISEYGDWENMAILYYNDQGSVNVHTDHQYRTFARDGENGTKEIMLPGYKFGHVRIVFPRKKTNFTISYSWTTTRKACKSLNDIADIVTCTDKSNLNSNCTVKCKVGFAPSPILYREAKDEIKKKLPLMSTTCRGNGFQPPDWFPKISIQSSFDMDSFIYTYTDIPIPTFPIQILEPGVKEWYRAILISPEIVGDFWKEELLNSRECVGLENIADVCFGGKSTLMSSWFNGCDYPIDYLLELFGEDGDTGIDPDTIPAPTKLTRRDRILQMDSKAKLQLLIKLIEQRGRFFEYVIGIGQDSCVVDEYEDLYNVLLTPVTTSNIDSIWDEFRGQVNNKCYPSVVAIEYMIPQSTSKICELVKVKLSGGKTTYDYKYKCASFRGPGRRGECIISRHGKNKLCRTLKASG
ncbi:uncharacterized protein LOC120328874 [Styela clava]